MTKKQFKDQLSDDELLKLSRKGDEEAFVILYRRHQGSVFRFAFHMLGRRETSEEVVQDVFMAMLEKSQLYHPARGALQGYLLGIARNKIRRHLAEARLFASKGSTAESLNRSAEEAERDEDLAALRSAIASLPAAHREVLVLCDLEGMDYAEAARQLSCPIGTVRSRLHRARTFLAAKIRRLEGCTV